jgi:hypothetical protein
MFMVFHIKRQMSKVMFNFMIMYLFFQYNVQNHFSVQSRTTNLYLCHILVNEGCTKIINSVVKSSLFNWNSLNKVEEILCDLVLRKRFYSQLMYTKR